MLRLVHRIFVFAALALLAASNGMTADFAGDVLDNLNQKSDISISFRDVEISEAMEMLAKKERVNILLAKAVVGTINVNLYDVTIDEAIHSIASAAGFAVERRNGTYYILRHDDAGKHQDSGLTKVQTFKIQYSDPSVVEQILKKYLSRYGSITIMQERKLLLVEDMPNYIERVARLLRELDQQPRQILIEAKILEVTLDDTESYGLDWRKIVTAQKGDGNFGIRGLSSPASPGFFFDFINPNIEVFLDTLKARGRVRTLSTPKLLAMENQEAQVIIGDRIGYKVTTTINQVTTESIEFLESGVILKVTPSVDGQGRIMLDVHPEVSTGNIADGIPSQTATAITTQLLVPDQKTVFMGGLMKQRLTEVHDGVPVLGDLPIVGRLFSNREKVSVNTETVVLITPYLIDEREPAILDEMRNKVSETELLMQKKIQLIDTEIESLLNP